MPTISGHTLNVRDICFGNNIFVASGHYVAGGYNGWTAYSTDGVNFTAAAFSGETGIAGVAFGNGEFCCVGQSGKVYASGDGKTWTYIGRTGAAALNNVVFNGVDKFVAAEGTLW
jgi:hypothetical protein